MARQTLSARAFKKILKSLPVDINDQMDYMCGTPISKGLYRDVYALKECEEGYVVKIERDMGTGMFANATEWRNYMNYQMTPIGELLCPIEMITQTGQLMIMRRARILNKHDLPNLPKKLPAGITDLKLCNFGYLDTGNLVAVDYSFLIADQNIRKVKWLTHA